MRQARARPVNLTERIGEGCRTVLAIVLEKQPNSFCFRYASNGPQYPDIIYLYFTEDLRFCNAATVRSLLLSRLCGAQAQVS